MNLQLFAAKVDEGDDNDGDDNNDGNDDDNDDEGDDEGDDVNKSKKAKTFTQKELDAKIAREKRRAKLSTYKSLGLGNLSEEELQKQMKQFAEWQKEQLSDDEKNAAKDNDLKLAIQKAELAERKLIAISNGVNPEFVDDFIAIAAIKVNDDKSFEDVVEELKESKAYKSLFAKAKKKQEQNEEEDDDDDSDENNKSKGTGRSSQSKKQTKKDSKFGARLAENASKSASKNSYFN